MKIYFGTLVLAGQPVNCGFEYLSNLGLCKEFLQKKYAGGLGIYAQKYERDVFLNSNPGKEWKEDAENKAMICLASDYLLPYNRMLFHSVAFVYKGNAFLVTAPSGTGKTTQYKNLKELYGDDIQIICGDNPVLHFIDQNIMVHPSPWKGKEGYGSMLVAPLGGIVYLKQASENRITQMEPKDAVIPIFNAINTYSKTPKLVDQMFKLEEKLITSVPVYLYENTGTLESSEILLNTLRKEVCHEI